MTAPGRRGLVTRWLDAAPRPVFVAYATGAAFLTYFSMFAFRKPFAAAEYVGADFTLDFLGASLALSPKTVFAMSQVVGYMTAKFAGIKYCSEITRGRRAAALLVVIGVAELALVAFATAPPWLRPVAIFLNGMPLGMIWGLVVWYLEGRRTSEILLAGLSCSYIVASGVVKDVGRLLMREYEVSEWWMPAATGLCFLPVYVLAVWLLDQIPQPDRQDVAARTGREPMGGVLRRRFVKTFLPGLALLFTVYFFVTAFRDYRDFFQADILNALGYEKDPTVFSRTETLVAFGVLSALALLNFFKNNRHGLIGAYAIMSLGVGLLGLSTYLLEAGQIDAFWWMTLVGLGSFLAYVPYGSVLFDRLIASTGVVGTAVFAIYVADAIGYTGTVGVMVYKEAAHAGQSPLSFFKGFSYFLTVFGVILLLSSCLYFLLRHAPGDHRKGNGADRGFRPRPPPGVS